MLKLLEQSQYVSFEYQSTNKLLCQKKIRTKEWKGFRFNSKKCFNTSFQSELLNNYLEKNALASKREYYNLGLFSLKDLLYHNPCLKWSAGLSIKFLGLSGLGTGHEVGFCKHYIYQTQLKLLFFYGTFCLKEAIQRHIISILEE